MQYIYPTLLKSANFIKLDESWFDFTIRKNYKYRKKHCRKPKQINSTYTETFKLKLYPDEKQKKIIKSWLDDCIYIYNITNEYIKNNISVANYKTLINFYDLRKKLNEKLYEVCKINKLNKHTADYCIHHCVTMYKSALSNHKNDLSKFEIKNLVKEKRRKNLVIEPANVSKSINSIFSSQLGIISSSSPLNLINRNSILQYDRIKNEFYIIIPREIEATKDIYHNKKVGVDIGVRTFITTYSKAESLEIGSNCCRLVDKYNKKLDSIKSNYDNKLFSNKIYEKAFAKYSDKLKNHIKDLHLKVSNILLKNYQEIIIGKVSIKKMISNLTGNIQEITKRRLIGLSHYKFREILKQRAHKFGCKIIEINEYLTSKTCHNCKNINDNLGSSKIFKCFNCKLKIDRDINAAINIYKNEKLTR